MARPREFDEDQALDSARNEFWARGIAATTISNLSDATGLSVGSIYKAFQNKTELCHRTLDDYLVRGLDQAAEILTGAPTARLGIEALLDLRATTASDTSKTRGCYAVACTVELAGTDPAVKARLIQHDRQMAGLMSDALRKAAQEEGLQSDPELGAQLLLATMSGLQVESRKGIEFKEARTILDMALTAVLISRSDN